MIKLIEKQALSEPLLILLLLKMFISKAGKFAAANANAAFISGQ